MRLKKSVKRCPVQLSVSRRTLAAVPTTSMLVKRLWMPVAGPFPDHVDDGRSHLNFSDWGRWNRNEQREMLEEICREVKRGDMPLSSYTPLHPGSKLTADDVKTICDWTNRQQATLGPRE